MPARHKPSSPPGPPACAPSSPPRESSVQFMAEKRAQPASNLLSLRVSDIKTNQPAPHAPHDSDDEEDTVLPVFGLGSSAKKLSPPLHRTSQAAQSASSPRHAEQKLPRDYRRSRLRISREPNVPDAASSDEVTLENATDVRPSPPTVPKTQSPLNLDIWISKLIIASLDRESPGGMEICFGDPLLSEKDAYLRGITQLDRFPTFSGSSSNIYRMNLPRSNGQTALLAMKQLRVQCDDLAETESIMTRLKRAVGIWSELKHPNVLPFLGVYDIGAPLPIFLSPFCEFGHIGNYLRSHPSANRHQLMHGVAFGLQYLHSHGVVHGDLKVANVLIDKRQVPCICDFNISQIVGEAGFTKYSAGSITCLAPELFSVLDMDGRSTQLEPPRPTKCSDVYSFACLALDILTPSPPPAKMGTPFVTRKDLAALRPDRAAYPVNSVAHELWLVLDQCWMADPYLRPTMDELLASPAFGVTREHKSLPVPRLMLRPLFESEGDGNEIAFGDHCLRSLPGHVRSIAKQSKFPPTTAGYWDVCRANLDLCDGRRVQVVMKSLKSSPREDLAQVQKLVNLLSRQAHIWSKLKHSNVLPFLGLYDVGQATPILVSPFCKFGHVGFYVRNHPVVNRTKLVHDVACGLKYLHDLDIIHGNLVVDNILVDKRGIACISDPGTFKLDLPASIRTAAVHIAPELFVTSKSAHTEQKLGPPTKMSDMYSVALVALEILTAEGLKKDTAEVFPRLGAAQSGGNTRFASTWTALHQCRNSNPELRPTIAEILESPQFSGLDG
ncbi:Glycoside hydrolase family 76 protein [Mycena sanguinolenta]|uniref:Glycoside hydrolase family 76 protein n=1 Tax=Mycena sanguinolenta TaxID=230812 RepID=A0A8H7D4P6_9AGAR|nr:Glycoside hydrolase family 76 protein [Mycena sanguinolenta]